MAQRSTCLARGLILAATILSSGSAFAQWDSFTNDVPGAVSLVRRTFDPVTKGFKDVQQVFNDPAFFSNMGNAVWHAAHADLQKQLVQDLGKGDLIAKGVTLYDINARLADDCKVQLARSSGGIVVKCELSGNSMDFHSTQPTALGKYADPKFSLAFDMALYIVVNVPSETQPLKVQSVSVDVQNAKLDSQNLVADLIFVFDDVSKFVGGPDFVKIAQDRIDGSRVVATGSDRYLGPLNQKIASLWSSGFKELDALLGDLTLLAEVNPMPAAFDAGTTTLYATKSDVPTTGNGVISGSIRWSKTYGHPESAPPPSRFQLYREVQAAPAPLKLGVYRRGVLIPIARVPDLTHVATITATVPTGPATPGTFVGPQTRVGKVVITGTSETAQDYVVNYEIRNLPTDVPISLQVSDSHHYDHWQPGADPASASKPRVFGPDRWEGYVMVRRGAMTNFHPDGRPVIGARNADELNPQPLPPGPDPNKPAGTATVSSGVGRYGAGGLRNGPGITPGGTTTTPPLRNPPVTRERLPVAAFVRTNPSALGVVPNIDFRMGLLEGPH